MVVFGNYSITERDFANPSDATGVVHQGKQTSAHDAPAVREVMHDIRNRQKGRPSPKKAPLIDTDLTSLVDPLVYDHISRFSGS